MSDTNDSTNPAIVDLGIVMPESPKKTRDERTFLAIRTEEFAARFWAKVDKSDECWLWTGGFSTKGYGQIHVSFPGELRGRGGELARMTLLSHRVAWRLINGEIPPGLELLHNCPSGDNPACVNPAHMSIGTHAENMADSIAKNRHCCGSRHDKAKITEEIVRLIRSRYAAGGITQQKLADEYGITNSVVCVIISRKKWRHVE